MTFQSLVADVEWGRTFRSSETAGHPCSCGSSGRLQLARSLWLHGTRWNYNPRGEETQLPFSYLLIQVSIREERFLNIPSMLQYVANGAGPLTSLGGVEGLAWINTKFANRSEDRPDLEIMFVSGSIVADSGTVKTVQGVTDRVFDNLYRPLLGRDTFSFLLQVTRPTSR